MTTRQLFYVVRNCVINRAQIKQLCTNNVKYIRIGVMTAIFVFGSAVLLSSAQHKLLNKAVEQCPIASIPCAISAPQ